MGEKYIIELEDKPFHKENGDFLYRVKGFNSLVFDMTGIGMLTPYIEPDLELIKQKAHDNGYSEGYQDGYCKGMNDYLQKPEVKEESDRAYAHGYSDAESKFSEIRKEAYQKGYETGYEDGYNEPGKNQQEAYQRGLADAWDAARKIVLGDINIIASVFGTVSRSIIIRDLTSAEVIEKLKAYKQKQDAEIKVGDEVKAFEKKPFIVTGFGYGDDEEDVYCYGFVTENGISTSAKKSSCVRTGRHFDEIATVLKQMRSESNAQIDT